MLPYRFLYIMQTRRLIWKNWFVANDDGTIAGHDLDEYQAKILAAHLLEETPDARWEALQDE